MQELGYTRVSTKNQVDNTSLESQADLIRSYCKLKGFQNLNIYTEKGWHGDIPFEDRPVGAEVEELIRAGEVRAFITTKLDRSFRDTEDCLRCMRAWREYGVAIHIINFGDMPVDTSTPVGKLIVTLFAGVAEFERNLTRERVQMGINFRRKQGRAVSSIAPYGFRLGPVIDDDEKPYRRLIPVKEEQKTLQLMMRLRAEGLTNGQIAKRLQGMNIIRRNGEEWNTYRVLEILRGNDKRGLVQLATSEEASESVPESAGRLE